MRTRIALSHALAAWLLACAIPAQDSPGQPDSRSVHNLLAAVAIDSNFATGEARTVRLFIHGTNTPLRLDLRLASHRAPGFVLLLVGDDGVAKQVDPPPVATYRGVVAGTPGSHVTCSITEEGLHGIVTLPDLKQCLSITPLPRRDNHAPAHWHVVGILHPQDARPLACGTREIGWTEDEALFEGGNPGSNHLALADIVVDTDREFFTRHGDDRTQALREIENLVGRANLYFEGPTRIRHRVMAVVLRTSTGPYAGRTSDDLVNALRSFWLGVPGYPRTLAYLISGKELEGPFVGQVYYRGAPCNTDKAYGMSTVRGFSAVVSATVIAHEFGHI